MANPIAISKKKFAVMAQKAAKDLDKVLSDDQIAELWSDWTGSVFEDSSCETKEDVAEAVIAQISQYFEVICPCGYPLVEDDLNLGDGDLCESCYDKKQAEK